MDESEIQAAQLNQQIAIVRSKIGEPVKDWSNEMIKRFLVARKNDIEKACEMLKNHLVWHPLSLHLTCVAFQQPTERVAWC